jgi:transglutaminase-like putative cysteine protease
VSLREVRVRYAYTYDQPIRDLNHRLVVVPPDRHDRQHLVEHSLEVHNDGGPVTLSEARDQFGNRVHRVIAARVERSIAFEARYVLRRTAPARRACDARRFVCLTALTTPDARLRDAAVELRAAAGPRAHVRELAERAHEWAAASLVWQLGVTSYQTPAAVALEMGKGVCQDYAHILLTLLRLLDIPARYVSGHLLGGGPPHAWVEALVGRGEVVGFDPSHGRQTTSDYLTVAVGRDFADVTPTSGVFVGARPASTLSYHKTALQLEDVAA